MPNPLGVAAQRLKNAGSDTPLLDSQLLAAHVLGISREQLLMTPDVRFSEDQLQRFESLLHQREKRMPIAYILGKREFWGMDFGVTPATLIPRPDSETLISALLEYQPKRAAPLRMLDLGTGSGCLLISALSEYPQATGLGVDINPEALEAARQNAEALGFAKRTEFKKSDWNSEIKGVWDVVLSNPPYIPAGEIGRLSLDVAHYEPRLALDGGDSGLDCYRAITSFLPEIMAEGGIALLEVGARQASDVAAMAKSSGLSVADMVRDLAGIERCVVITK